MLRGIEQTPNGEVELRLGEEACTIAKRYGGALEKLRSLVAGTVLDEPRSADPRQTTMPDDDDNKRDDGKQDDSKRDDGSTDPQMCTHKGRSYKHGEERCDEKVYRIARCDNGSWIMTEQPCIPGQRDA